MRQGRPDLAVPQPNNTTRWLATQRMNLGLSGSISQIGHDLDRRRHPREHGWSFKTLALKRASPATFLTSRPLSSVAVAERGTWLQFWPTPTQRPGTGPSPPYNIADKASIFPSSCACVSR